ncbi:MAG TPA: aspartate-semialdehyde dehydrogenase [Bacteroidales bacterium]|nr:aspartate-semialdehyde dehydrogenase [Bacteroidales bacterium]
MKIAVVGATGLVGRTMMEVIKTSFPASVLSDFEILAVASEASAGQRLSWNDKTITVITLSEAIRQKPDIALFSAGSQVSLDWAPRFAELGGTVIDNSSAWRRDPSVPLIVPEVNGDVLDTHHRIIANPNCSTIQLVMALAPLQQAYGLERVVVSTYQSVTGAGQKGISQLEDERNGKPAVRAFPHQIDLNIIPEGGYFLENAYTSEEDKLVFESAKILREPGLRLTATVVRVPVRGGHSESVNVALKQEFDIVDIRKRLAAAPGIVVLDDPASHLYPMPLFAEGRDEVFVGRIRRDDTIPNGLNMWIVSDNLRKGAATNAVQIVKLLMDLR